MKPRTIAIVGNIPDCRSKKKTFRNNLVSAKPFAEIWPQILAYRMANKTLTNKSVWNEFKNKISDVPNLVSFTHLLNGRGLDTRSIEKATTPKEETKLAIKTFSDVRKAHAERHMTKVSGYLNKAHDVVESIIPDEETIGSYLDTVRTLHREGRLAYRIDEEVVGNPQLLNLALLVEIRPENQPLDCEGTVIDT